MTEGEITKARNELLAKADDRKILDNLKDYPMDKFSMNRHAHMNPELIEKVFPKN
jgi:ferredoxin hydrogenase large subunit